MIKDSEIIKIGTLAKPHGIKGEIVASMDFDLDLTSLKCIIVPIDGIYVPFFITGSRPKSADAEIIAIEGIDNESQAKELCGADFYALMDDVEIDKDADGGYIADFIGYRVTGSDGKTVGTIRDYDDSTPNVLFIIEDASGQKRYIPVAPELITGMDHERRILSMELPDGLMEIQNNNS